MEDTKRIKKAKHDLSSKNKNELINEIIGLRKKLKHRENKNKKPLKLLKTRDKPFSIYVYQQIALKICYLGWNYHGFAVQSETTTNTVENEIFTAFDKLKLIQNSISDSNYSRCGRTDTGVSAICQVISCRLRANCKLTENLPTEKRNELDDKLYLRGLNGVLPSDIRIISWCHVSNEFNARFDCISRTYKYYMPSKGLDLNLMNNSSKLFKGNHDFRNLCKVTMSNPVKHFLRTILEIGVESLNQDECVLNVKGLSFLHNQIRNIAFVLLTIGLKLESPSIITKLLNINECPNKPEFAPLSGTPLIFYDCEFNNHLSWRLSKAEILRDLRISHVELLAKNFVLESLLRSASPFNVFLQEFPSRCLMSIPCFQKYIPIMERQKSEKRSEKIKIMLMNL